MTSYLWCSSTWLVKYFSLCQWCLALMHIALSSNCAQISTFHVFHTLHRANDPLHREVLENDLQLTALPKVSQARAISTLVFPFDDSAQQPKWGHRSSLYPLVQPHTRIHSRGLTKLHFHFPSIWISMASSLIMRKSQSVSQQLHFLSQRLSSKPLSVSSGTQAIRNDLDLLRKRAVFRVFGGVCVISHRQHPCLLLKTKCRYSIRFS